MLWSDCLIAADKLCEPVCSCEEIWNCRATGIVAKHFDTKLCILWNDLCYFGVTGTSLPDLFASKQAATMEKTADSSVGNVTGSNSVNVFLGLGLPWVMASVYHYIKNVS